MTILRRGAPSVGRGAAGLWAVSLMIIGTAATPATAATAVERPAGYPSKAVRLLVGSSPGGGADLTTRLMAQRLSDQWGKPVIVDNRAGGSGAIAMELTASAAPDGYTFMSTGSLIVTATPLKKVPFDTRKVFTPIVQMTTQPYRLVTHPAVAAATVRELIELARRQPGALRYGSSGSGSAQHLGMAMFAHEAKIDMLHVPYKGAGQALTDLLGGQIQVFLAGGIGGSSFINAGKLRAIAVTSRSRLPQFPGLPTVAESGLSGYELYNMYAIYGPLNVPPSIVLSLNRAVNDIMHAPDVREKLAADGTDPAPVNTPAEFRNTFVREVNRWESFFSTTKLSID